MPVTQVNKVANKPTSLKLPAELKAQLEVVAQKAGLSVHAFMVQAIAESVRSVQLRESFSQDSLSSVRDMKSSGLGFALEDVHAYFSQLSEYRKGQGPKPLALAPTRVA